KHIEWDGDKFSGYVDLGTQLDNDCLPPAKQALTFMLNALNANWKIPVAYFLINSLNAIERSNLISECLRLVFDTGVEVTALTFYGTSVNISTANNLGAKIQEKDMKPYFPHPITSEKVFVILDVCHMLKLVRNTLASKGSIVNQNGDIIKWDYIKELEKFQKDKGLYAAPKLKSRHIEWYQEKMKVKLAAQVLSNSVADALLYLANDLKLEEFQGCEATVEFLKIFNNLFDVLNSRNFLSKGFKAPFSGENKKKTISSFFSKAENYIKELKIKAGAQSILSSNRKTGFLGFLLCIKSIEGIYDALIEKKKNLNFLLTYKLSQDHLELFFSAIRSRGGFNNNPTSKQFKAAYRRLLCHTNVSFFLNGNCLALDNTSVLEVSSSNTYTKQINRYFNCDSNNESESEINIDDPLKSFTTLCKYADDVVIYIAGFVAKKLKSAIKCSHCSIAIGQEACESALITRKNRGSLISPNKDIVGICRAAEKSFRRAQAQNILRKKHIMNILITYTILQVEKNVFTNLSHHIINQSPLENHRIFLIKSISFEYLRIRLYSYGKEITENLHKEKVRSKNTKLKIFKGQ
ncbi:DNA transposase THAP9, partial [Araneus ventricosus]